MLRIFLAAAFLTMPQAVWAADKDSTPEYAQRLDEDGAPGVDEGVASEFALPLGEESELELAPRCQDIRNVNRCRNTYGCRWDRYYGCVRDQGGGGQRTFECTAADNGWEEHWGGHRALGRTQMAASRNALRECERFHGSCRVTRCQAFRNF